MQTQKESKPVHLLMQRQVDRKEFLSIAGFGFLTVVGLGPIIHFLTGKSSSVLHKYQKTGYGAGPYGV